MAQITEPEAEAYTCPPRKVPQIGPRYYFGVFVRFTQSKAPRQIQIFCIAFGRIPANLSK